MNRNKEEGLNIEFKLAMADNLPYPSNTFDVITIFENIYGFITPRSAGLSVLQVTTNVSVCKNPKENSAKLHGQGLLVYVPQRPK
jgi:hypothetical protein